MNSKKQQIRRQLLENLAAYGIRWHEDSRELSVADYRNMQRKLALNTNAVDPEIAGKISHRIAKPELVDIHQIRPTLVPVSSRSIEDRRLWAYAKSFWSVPITAGYGRRMRYFVIDESNNRLIGIIGLCDPVIGLKARDSDSVGWSRDQKERRLYNCLTAYVLGAIPPYNAVLGGKLVALSIMFPKIRKDFEAKYEDQISVISGLNKEAKLVYVDTLGAFGKSALYTRLLNWKFVGYTKGVSHLHITANGSWELIRELVPDEVYNTYKFGKGPNWKIRVLRHGLRELGLPEQLLGIGWQRAYYRCALADNWRKYLLGESDDVVSLQYTEEQLIEYWRRRWIEPRLSRLQLNLKEIEG